MRLNFQLEGTPRIQSQRRVHANRAFYNPICCEPCFWITIGGLGIWTRALARALTGSGQHTPTDCSVRTSARRFDLGSQHCQLAPLLHPKAHVKSHLRNEPFLYVAFPGHRQDELQDSMTESVNYVSSELL